MPVRDAGHGGLECEGARGHATCKGKRPIVVISIPERQEECMRLVTTATILGLISALQIQACESGTDGLGGDSGPDSDSDSDSDTDTGVDSDPFDDCTSVTEGADNSLQPADIIFAIDNSPSLEDEIAAVRANMNAFSESIMNSGIDVRIALVSCLPGDCGSSGGGGSEPFGICIDPPLGADDGCQGDPEVGPVSDDTNLPHYLHLSTRVPSFKVLEWITTTYADANGLTDQGWQGILRANATKHVVIVSDDADETSAADFDAAFTALDPLLSGYVFHGIFAPMSKDEACAIGDSEPCCEFAAPLDDSLDWDAYQTLVDMTGGVTGDLCLQDFDPVFDALAASVVASSVVNCEWVIPVPPDDQELDPNLVNVEFVHDGESYFVGRVDSVDDCEDVTHGWYYDDPESPTIIYVCPQTCEWFQSEENASLTIHFGCESEYAVE
jgi:hypothetical protein